MSVSSCSLVPLPICRQVEKKAEEKEEKEEGTQINTPEHCWENLGALFFDKMNRIRRMTRMRGGIRLTSGYGDFASPAPLLLPVGFCL